MNWKPISEPITSGVSNTLLARKNGKEWLFTRMDQLGSHNSNWPPTHWCEIEPPSDEPLGHVLPNDSYESVREAGLKYIRFGTALVDPTVDEAMIKRLADDAGLTLIFKASDSRKEPEPA